MNLMVHWVKRQALDIQTLNWALRLLERSVAPSAVNEQLTMALASYLGRDIFHGGINEYQAQLSH